jgi:hypothetical protein
VNNVHSVLSTLKKLQLDSSMFSSPTLSSTQITEITTAIINHLKKHGKVTLELINFIRDRYSSPKNTRHPLHLKIIQHFSLVTRCQTLLLFIIAIPSNSCLDILDSGCLRTGRFFMTFVNQTFLSFNEPILLSNSVMLSILKRPEVIKHPLTDHQTS